MNVKFLAGRVELEGKKYRCVYGLRNDGICVSGKDLPYLGGETIRDEVDGEVYSYEFFSCDHACYAQLFEAWWEEETRLLDRAIERVYKKICRLQRELNILEEEKVWLDRLYFTSKGDGKGTGSRLVAILLLFSPENSLFIF